MRSIRTIPLLQNIPVLVRAALNVPLENGTVVNDYRLRRALPTITYLTERGARVVLISHIGELGTETLEPVARALAKLTRRVSFCPETVGAKARAAVRGLMPGDILVMENLRRAAGEKTNDPTFAKELSALGDVFVQDSFDTCHRMHASIVGVPKLLPSYAGLLLQEEMAALTAARTPAHPSLAVVGGAKFSTKETVLTVLLKTYDQLFIGGALSNDFLKASGCNVGKSLVSDDDVTGMKELLKNPKLVLPVDARVVSQNELGSMGMHTTARIVPVTALAPDDVILDHGPATSALLAELARHASFVLWNGPLGNYENGFGDSTDAFAQAVARSTAHSVVGGGDTVASIENLGLLSRFSFVSTGGGAMLDLLAHDTLPGIVAIAN